MSRGRRFASSRFGMALVSQRAYDRHRGISQAAVWKRTTAAGGPGPRRRGLASVLITGQVAGDGRSDWLKGVQLLAVYVILGLAFFFVTPERPTP